MRYITLYLVINHNQDCCLCSSERWKRKRKGKSDEIVLVFLIVLVFFFYHALSLMQTTVFLFDHAHWIMPLSCLSIASSPHLPLLVSSSRLLVLVFCSLFVTLPNSTTIALELLRSKLKTKKQKQKRSKSRLKRN